jgi:GTP cyclohydrolase II
VQTVPALAVTPLISAPAVPARRLIWAGLRLLGGLGILAILLWRLGSGPFLDGLRMIDARAIAAALTIGAVTTVASAWRWQRVARGLGIGLPLSTAVAYCYRAVFLNTTLPGGVLGDVHRAVSHGRQVGDLGRGVRGVVWERVSGQVVQVVVALIILAALPSPVRSYTPAIAGLVVAAVALLVVVVAALPRGGRSGWARGLRTVVADVRGGLRARRSWWGVAAASTIVVTGHLATFMVAARTAGATASLGRLLPLTLLALMATLIPLNVAGFGPREGAAAWAFGAAGLTAGLGVATATVYGALVLVGSLPGAVVLVRQRFRTPAVLAPQPPPASIRTRISVPLRFPDGFVTRAEVFTFEGLVDGREHLALGLGDWNRGPDTVLVRPHSECLTGDVFGSQRCDCGPQLREAIERIAATGGVLLYLRQEGRGIGLYAKLDAYALQDSGLDTYEANVALGHGEDERDYTAAAQMLIALGVTRTALLTNNPDKAAQLRRHGITVTEQVPTGIFRSPDNGRYLAAKAQRAAEAWGPKRLEAGAAPSRSG